jgi:uncharacterized phiE125 gp8 family phage protein
MAIPVTLADARLQLKMEPDDTSRDTELQGFIADAAAWVESYTGHILVAREVTETFPGFGRLALRAWPIKADAVVALSYTAGLIGPVIVTGARLAAGSARPARVHPAFGTVWPHTGLTGTVSVTVRAGYEPGDPVPGNFRRAMLVLIGACDEDREGGDLFAKAEAAAKSLCRGFRARGL